jgi:2-(1,2-epoxy-1,2-dihydrophenyl)acetyl-CoA isomerase
MLDLRNAMQIALPSGTCDAADARRMRLANRGVPSIRLRGRARAPACRLAAGPGLAYERTKRRLRPSVEYDFSIQLDARKVAFFACRLSNDFKPRLRPFLPGERCFFPAN